MTGQIFCSRQDVEPIGAASYSQLVRRGYYSAAMIELETVADFDSHVDQHDSLDSVAVQALDLCDRSEVLLTISVDGAVFMGCVVEPEVQRRLIRDATVFPRFPNLPFRAFRAELYDADELFGGYTPGDKASFEAAFDTKVYRWFDRSRQGHNVVDLLAQRVHDHSIDDALEHVLDDGTRDRVVAIMGGHGMRRDEESYVAVARLARQLTRSGFVCASGGGPGAMEATNFGAWMATHADGALDEALAVLAAAPTFEPVPDWLDAAFDVRLRWPLPHGTLSSLGIPTWHYGHEPPNVFASHIAKYFANSIREDGLLAIALAGVVFAPGSAGTIQEVFQDAAQNHYKSFGIASPMVFMGRDYWTHDKPVYPLLAQLADGHDYGELLAIEDDVDAIAARLSEHARLRG